MKELSIRAATGAVYVALTLGAAWAGKVTTFLLFLPVCAIAARELHRLLFANEDAPPMAWSVLLAVGAYTASGLAAILPQGSMTAATAATFALLLLLFTALLLRGTSAPGHAVGGLLMQVVLVALPFGMLPHLFAHGPWLFVGFMLLLWTNDTGAYLVGRTLGRTKLLSAVSPKKTVEGFIGGVLLTLLVAYLLAMQHSFMTPVQWLVCGTIVALASTLGDLLESALKRARGVKDSGAVLPGHGGILDRFDGFLLALPAMFLYLKCVG